MNDIEQYNLTYKLNEFIFDTKDLAFIEVSNIGFSNIMLIGRSVSGIVLDVKKILRELDWCDKQCEYKLFRVKDISVPPGVLINLWKLDILDIYIGFKSNKDLTFYKEYLFLAKLKGN